MKTEQSPRENVKIVLYLDANMPKVPKCNSGCEDAKNYPCLHRFGHGVRVVGEQSRLNLTRMTDLQVILDFIYIIFRRFDGWNGGRSRSFVIVTHDKPFLETARQLHETQRNMRKLPLTFGRDYVNFCGSNGNRVISILIRTVDIRHSNKIRDLRSIINIANSLCR